MEARGSGYVCCGWLIFGKGALRYSHNLIDMLAVRVPVSLFSADIVSVVIQTLAIERCARGGGTQTLHLAAGKRRLEISVSPSHQKGRP